MKYFKRAVSGLILFSFAVFYSCSSSNSLSSADSASVYDTVKAKRFDTGKMWTFEDAPVDYFEEAYGFKPTQEWLDDVRMSALKFATWCTSSFVSEDGLIMTNHHCVDFISSRIQQEGEDIWKNGFMAENLEDERPVPGVTVDQLVLIDDVTGRINDELENSGMKNNSAILDSIISGIEKEYSDDTKLICKITPLYNGGKYSLYGYRRYDDVRAVFFNAAEIGLYGGDPDNFTYPRYDLDFALLRVYENDKPAKIDHYFKFSKDGAKPGEPLFVIGNPGTTERLNTVTQLEYKRDFRYKNVSFYLSSLVDINYEMMKLFPERAKEFEENLMMLANSAKVYKGMYEALQNPELMARKKDFEKTFKNKILSKPGLKEKYSYLWDALKANRLEYSQITPEFTAFGLNPRFSPAAMLTAKELITAARTGELSQEQIRSFIPINLDEPYNDRHVKLQIEYIIKNVGKDNPAVKECFRGNSIDEMFKYVKGNSDLMSEDGLKKIADMTKDDILKSTDPLLKFYNMTYDEFTAVNKKKKEIEATEETLSAELGRALYAVYGTSIPPDATFTLRISDGVIKDYEYNGTKAPEFTTFYGLYDRYHSFKEQYPWDLPEIWKNPPQEFDLSTPYNFITTNDITGGSSGSPVINKNAELVGIAFDGNIESLSGSFIYTTESNRTVAVTSQAIIEALSDLYHFKRIAYELKNSKMKPQEKKQEEPVEAE